MRFKIGAKTYDIASVNDLSLKMLLQLEQQTADFGRPITVGQFEAWTKEFEGLTANQAKDHPQVLMLTAVTIWAARKLAGEDVTFEQAVDFPVSQMTFLPEPADHKAPANPTKARSASGRAGSAPRRRS